MRHFLSVDDFSPQQWRHLLGLEAGYYPDRVVCLLFYENSTRTKLSFERAAKSLHCEVMDFSIDTSSVAKGESLDDTTRVIEALGADIIVVRHSTPYVPDQMTKWVQSGIVNAGDGIHQHPSQALVDCYTLCERFGDISGMTIAIVGDLRNSRVARSCIRAFGYMGAHVKLCAPSGLALSEVNMIGFPGVEVVEINQAMACDVVYVLRLQKERLAWNEINDWRYSSECGLTEERFAQLRPETVIMHPGPMNVGVEICEQAAQSPQSLILAQVRNGPLVRAKILSWVLGRT